MNKTTVLGMIICLLFVLSPQVIYGQEVKEEPEPIPESFPGESESEKIQRLQEQITELKKQKLILEEEIMKLNEQIENLYEITMEQIKVIMDLVGRINIIFDNSLSSVSNF